MPKQDPDPFLVISLRHGLGGSSPMALGDVAVRLRYTRERIRQVENEVLRRLHYPRYWQSLRSGFYLASGDLY
jgi:DNA-directed RNA polymerase sigma subunit (sigma70/sigma32)